MAVWTSLEKQLNPKGPIASRGGPYHILRKYIGTCDFPGGGVRTPMSQQPSRSAHGCNVMSLFYIHLKSVFESSYDCILITLENRFIVFESYYGCILITLENIFIVFESSYGCILITLENIFIV